MKRQPNFLVISIIVIAIAIGGLAVVYERFIHPNDTISATYIEVYKDLVPEEIDTLIIQSINHKVIVKTSTDDQFHISYFQKADNINTYTLSGRILTLNIVESAENLDNLFYKSKRAIDTITVSVPKNKALNFKNETISGSLIINKAILNVVTAESVSGSISIAQMTAEHLRTDVNSGFTQISDSPIVLVEVQSVNGSIYVNLPEPINNYQLDIDGLYGTLTVNNEQVADEAGEITTKLATSAENVVGSLVIRSTRSRIVLAAPLPPQITDDTPETETNNE